MPPVGTPPGTPVSTTQHALSYHAARRARWCRLFSRPHHACSLAPCTSESDSTHVLCAVTRKAASDSRFTPYARPVPHGACKPPAQVQKARPRITPQSALRADAFFEPCAAASSRPSIWVDGDFLWALNRGPPLSPDSCTVRAPLDAAGVQSAMHLVLQSACGMPQSVAARYTKQSARKTLVSAAQAAGCPWAHCIELGHWKGSDLGTEFYAPAEYLKRKKSPRMHPDA